MKKFLLLFLLSATAYMQAMIVQLPDASEIRACLKNDGLSFGEEIKLDQALSGKRLYPIDKVKSVKDCLNEHYGSAENSMAECIMIIRQNQLLRSVLKNFPEAIKDLKNQGYCIH